MRILFISLAALLAVSHAEAQYFVTTVAGGAGVLTAANNGGPAANAGIGQVFGLAVDPAGNVYAASSSQNNIDQLVLRISPAGVLTVVAGQTGLSVPYGGDGGLAVNTQLLFPMGLTFDAGGNLYVVDSGNQRVRRIGADGKIFDVAGNGSQSFGGDGGPAVYASLNNPAGVAEDRAGNIYIADFDNCRIRKVDTAGIISTIAGNGQCAFAGDGGPAISAEISNPQDVVVDSAGNLYIADYFNQRIRKIDSSGIITTVAGSGLTITSGDGGPAVSAGLVWPQGLALDPAGNIYVTGDNRLRKISPTGIITTVAGTGAGGFSGDGGPATAAQLDQPVSVTLDDGGALYVGDRSGRIRKIAPDGVISTIAGPTATYYTAGSPATSIGFLPYPNSAIPSNDGGFYVSGYAQLFKVSPSGYINSIAGNGVGGESGDGGPATQAGLENPYGMVEDASGNLFFADANRIRKIDARGIITTVAGTGAAGFSGDGGPAIAAKISGVYGIAADASGNLYIGDYGNHRVRKVTPGGIISTVAGTGQAGYTGDGGPATAAELDNPTGVAVDGSGNLYIVQPDEKVVRKVDTNGVITTFAGNGTDGYAGDGGPAASAALCFPWAVTADTGGNVFILDAGNDAVRKVDTNGIISTVGLYSASGSFALNVSVNDYVKLGGGISVDAAGNLYIADYFDLTVLKAQKITSTYVSGAVSAANSQPLASPGSLVTLYGVNLGAGPVSPTAPLPNSVGDTTVTLGDLPTPLLYVSPTQINLQIPFEAPLGTDTLNISRTSTGSTTAALAVATASPAIFRFAGQGLYAQGAITNLDGTLAAPSSAPFNGTPATAGQYITIWCTGLGDVTNRPTSGSATPGGPPYSQTLLTPTVTIGNTALTPSFAGLAPGYAGLYQVNVQVPADAPKGDAVNVRITIGNSSDVVLMAIQ